MMHPSDLQFLARHGTLWMFLATLGERLGLPLFVTPLLVAAGALAAMGKLHFGLLLLVTTVACLAGDTVWYELGRWKGSTLFGLLCRISFQPDSCVRRSELALARHTGRSLLWAKWLPGVAHLALPLAGAARISRPRFHLYNAAGSIAWLAALLAAGYLSMRTIDWLGVFVITARWAVALALVASVALAGAQLLAAPAIPQGAAHGAHLSRGTLPPAALRRCAGHRRSPPSAGFSGRAAHPAQRPAHRAQ